MTARNVNLACGTIFINSQEWENFDFNPNSPSVKKANLLKSLPLSSNSVDVVYSSHFLEHIPKNRVRHFLCECFRVLKPGGTLRLVLPDFEEMAQSYLTYRLKGEHDKADFLVLEIVDQCVRQMPGGELGKLYKRLKISSNIPSNNPLDIIYFIKERTGEDLEELRPSKSIALTDFSKVFNFIIKKIKQVWLYTTLIPVSPTFRAQNVSLTNLGERHQWLWDFYQLKTELDIVGFNNITRFAADKSAISDFPLYPLDLDINNLPRKGRESMYIESTKF